MIEAGTLFKHYRDMPRSANEYWLENWPNFSLAEIACSHCGELLVNEKAMYTIQRFRVYIMGPVFLNSAYRCKVHNDAVGSNDRSQHRLAAAFDVAHRTGHPAVITHIAKLAGFKGHGFYNTFQHLDIGPPRTWTAKDYKG